MSAVTHLCHLAALVDDHDDDDDETGTRHFIDAGASVGRPCV
jgi:hypothetical protein